MVSFPTIATGWHWSDSRCRSPVKFWWCVRKDASCHSIRKVVMEKVNEKKLDVLRSAIAVLNCQVANLCDIRPDIYSINLEEWKNQLSNIRNQIHAKQVLLFIGPFSSGKSSFINALLGEDILPTSNRPCTSVVTELSFVNGGGHRGRAVRKDKQPTELEYDYSQLLKMVDGPTGAIGESAAFHHMELQFDITQLPYDSVCLRQLCDAEVTIVDCPGYGSPYYSNEDVIEEYISKASHTFWINPVDRMGGAADYRRLSEIKKKTTTLIPIMSKADLIESESKKDEVCDNYIETIGNLFRSKDPIFCSAIKYRMGREIEKEISRKKCSGAELEAKKAEMNRLFEESGLSNVFAAVIDSASEQSVTDAKVKSVYHDLDDLMTHVSRAAERERAHWQTKLKQAGWSDDKNTALEEARKEVGIWIDGEAERVGRQLDNEIKDCIQSYVDSCNGSVSRPALLESVNKTLTDRLEKCEEGWCKRLSDSYGDKIRNVEHGKGKEVELPAWLNSSELMASLRDTRDVIFQTIRDSGVKTITEGGIGGVLLFSLGAIKGIAIVGGALAPVAAIVGGALVAVAAMGVVPVYSRHAKAKKEEQRRDFEKKINKWLENLNMRAFVWGLLTKYNNDLYLRLEKEQQKVGDVLIEKNNRCETVITEIRSLKENLQIQFASVK